ncbi:hypothetical protein O9992_30895 [Vibrio lentus]|nr:hypothetical protein [Vibrio lentus]
MFGLIFSELFAVVFMNELLLKLTQGQWAPTEVGIQGDDIESFQCLPQMGPAQLFSERPVTAFCIPETMMLSPIVLARQAQARPKAEDDAKSNSAFPNVCSIILFGDKNLTYQWVNFQ